MFGLWHKTRFTEAARGWSAAFVVLAMAGVSAVMAAPSVTASLDRDVVPVGETVTLTLTFLGGAPQAAPALPNLPNLQSTGGVNQSSKINIVNGQMTSEVILQYTLIPIQPGDVTIPAFRIAVGNTAVTTQPLKLKIVPAGTVPGGVQQTLSQWGFLRLVVPKNEVYVGEAFPVEIHLYWQEARDIRTPQLQADGFSLNQGQNPNYTQTRTLVGGKPYNLLVFRMAATAARAGDLTLGPASCGLTLLLPVAQPRRRDPFFDPFDFFGNRAEAHPTTLTSDPQRMKVLPLPQEKVPESFTGAVGQYTMSVSASPTNLAVGDPITLRVRIAGQGLLEGLSLPPQSHWRDFKIYPPSARVESNDPLGLAGAKTFEQVVIPQNHEIQALPSLVFSYFDSAARVYRTLSNAPVALRVSHAAQAGSPVPALTNAQDRVGPGADDIVHIKARFEGVVAWQVPLVQRPWFLGLQGVPVLAWLGLLVRRRHLEYVARNPKLQRQKQVARRVRQGLKELRQQAEAQQSETFFATLFRLLQEQLGQRLDLPASAITESVIDERLQDGQLPESVLAALRELFQACNQARYAPQVTGRGLVDLLPRVESVVQELRRSKQ